jgi:hypothetical protein
MMEGCYRQPFNGPNVYYGQQHQQQHPANPMYTFPTAENFDTTALNTLTATEHQHYHQQQQANPPNAPATDTFTNNTFANAANNASTNTATTWNNQTLTAPLLPTDQRCQNLHITNQWFYCKSVTPIKVINMNHNCNPLLDNPQGMVILFELCHRRRFKFVVDDLIPQNVEDNAFLQNYAEFFSASTGLQVNPIAALNPWLLYDIKRLWERADKEDFDEKKAKMVEYVKYIDIRAKWLPPCFTRNGKIQGRFEPDKIPSLYDLQQNDVIQFLLAFNIIRAYLHHLSIYLTDYQSKKFKLAGKVLLMHPIEFRQMISIIFNSVDFVEDLKIILRHYHNFIPKIPRYIVPPTVVEGLKFYYCTKKTSNSLPQDLKNVALIPAESESESSSESSSESDDVSVSDASLLWLQDSNFALDSTDDLDLDFFF